MTGFRPRIALAVCAVLALVAVSGCAQGEVDVEPRYNRAAVLFNQNCSGCHTLHRANSHGSKPEGELRAGDRTNGPNFSVRPVSKDDALFAIRNGGFSGAIMPANILVGKDAERVAEFLAKYSGEERGEDTDALGSGQQAE